MASAGRPSLLNLAPPRSAEARPLVAQQHLVAAQAALDAARAILADAEQQLQIAAIPPTDDARWATAKEAATYLRVKVCTVHELMRQAPAWVRRNRRVRELRVSLADLDRWLSGED